MGRAVIQSPFYLWNFQNAHLAPTKILQPYDTITHPKASGFINGRGQSSVEGPGRCEAGVMENSMWIVDDFVQKAEHFLKLSWGP